MENLSNPVQPSPFALAAAAAVRAQIAELGWTVQDLVERAEWLRDETAAGHHPALGAIDPRPLEPGLADRLAGVGCLNMDDLEMVAFVLGEDVPDFARRVVEAGQAT